MEFKEATMEFEVEYCTGGGYLPKAVSLTEKIAHDYKDRFARLSLVPSSGGVFEVRVDGREVYSKKATGEFPDQDVLVAEIGRLAGDQM